MMILLLRASLLEEKGSVRTVTRDSFQSRIKIHSHKVRMFISELLPDQRCKPTMVVNPRMLQMVIVCNPKGMLVALSHTKGKLHLRP